MAPGADPGTGFDEASPPVAASRAPAVAGGGGSQRFSCCPGWVGGGLRSGKKTKREARMRLCQKSSEQ